MAEKESRRGLCLFLIDGLTNYLNLEGSKEYVFYTWDMQLTSVTPPFKLRQEEEDCYVFKVGYTVCSKIA